MKDVRIEFRVSKDEKRDMQRLAESEGFASIAALLRWLVCFYKCEKAHGKIVGPQEKAAHQPEKTPEQVEIKTP